MDSEYFNYLVQKGYRVVKRQMLELRAKVSQKRFYCRVLSGESEYNLCVNCDMTVSCNCQDYDGSGHIGDLHNGNLEQVFASSKAVNFRLSMANGQLPILTCASCNELRSASLAEVQFRSENWQIPQKGIMVENTVNCPYRCRACYRKMVRKVRGSTQMSMNDIVKVSGLIRENGIQSLYFLSLGEPFAVSGIYDQLHAIRSDNPNLFINVSTNGLLLNTDEKREAAMLANHIYFSIDGINDHTMNKYQRGASFSKAYENMMQLVAHRGERSNQKPTIEWKYVLFNWNDHEIMIQNAIELAKKANIDTISFWPTMSPIYGISWRYYLKKYFKELGKPSWKGREICFYD